MWIVATLASLAIFLTLLLCVPLDMVFQVEAYGRTKLRIRLAWLFGLVSTELKGGREKAGKKGLEPEVKLERRKWGTRAGTIFKILRTRGLLRQLKRLLKDILSSIQFKDLRADIRMGLDDPADTGLLFAIIGPATYFINSSFPHRVSVLPYFKDEVVFEGSLAGVLRLWPVRLVISVLKLVFSLVTLRIVKTLVASRWKGRKK